MFGESERRRERHGDMVKINALQSNLWFELGHSGDHCFYKLEITSPVTMSLCFMKQGSPKEMVKS